MPEKRTFGYELTQGNSLIVGTLLSVIGALGIAQLSEHFKDTIGKLSHTYPALHVVPEVVVSPFNSSKFIAFAGKDE